MFQRYDFINLESFFETCVRYHLSKNVQIVNLADFNILSDVQVELLKHFQIDPLMHGMLI